MPWPTSSATSTTHRTVQPASVHQPGASATGTTPTNDPPPAKDPPPDIDALFKARRFTEAVAAHVPDLPFDCVLADSGTLDRDGLMDAALNLGADVRFAPVAAEGHAARHDPARLARAYADLMGIH